MAGSVEYQFEESINVGIAVLTAVRADPSRDTVMEVVGQYADDGDAALAALFTGVVTVGAMLLEGLANATGIPAEELLQDVAVRLAAGTSDDEES